MEDHYSKSNNNNNNKPYPNSCESSSMAENGKGGDKKKNGGSTKSRSKGVKLSTDPQSVAARERRHRISNRFKMLQSLVPGGTKMDTASMLDEAIHYVKYLKAQIWLHENMISFNNIIVDDDDDDDVSGTHVHLLPPSSSSAVDFADQEAALLMYSQSQSQSQPQQPEFYGGVQPSPPSSEVPSLPNCCYQLEEGTMYFDGYMQ